jgi:hypothetical protein
MRNDMRTLTPAVRDLFIASERIHFDFIRHNEEREALRRGREVRTCKRHVIGDSPMRHALKGR